MTSTPRWLKALAAVAVLMLLMAIGKPAIAGLLLRALAIGVVITLAIVVVAGAFSAMAPADGVGRRLDPRPPADVPRDLATLTEELRGTRRRDFLPVTVLRLLRIAIIHRLAVHHGLSEGRPDHHEAIRALLSQQAYQVLKSNTPDNAAPEILGRDLPAIVEEIERL